MRNLVEHPMTKDEIIQAVDDCRREIVNTHPDEALVGDMRPSLLAAAVQLLRGETPKYYKGE